MKKKRIVNLEVLEAAIVDGINMYLREVLLSRGLLSADQDDTLGERDLLEEKYRVAKTVASEWEVYEIDEE